MIAAFGPTEEIVGKLKPLKCSFEALKLSSLSLTVTSVSFVVFKFFFSFAHSPSKKKPEAP
uniref:Putative Xaa-Pro aminopeptidase P isoform X2 n=1 Tax=Rhizophora mucronata TaxID=61149 RepID=A0A2P2K086_RHIMU